MSGILANSLGLITQPVPLMIFSIFIIISVGFYLIIYLISKILDNQKLSQWSKKGVIEIGYAVLIFAMVLFAFPVIDNILLLIFGAPSGAHPNSSMLTGGVMGAGGRVSMQVCKAAQSAPTASAYYAVKNSCYLVMSVDFLDSIFKELFMLSKWMAIKYSLVSILANGYFHVHIAIDKQGSVGFVPLSGVYLPSNLVISEIFGWATKVMTLTKIQEIIIVFMATGGFTNIFLLGLILRSFVFTKKLGGTIMGIALALMLIYPAFYTFGDYIINNIRANIYAHNQNANTPITETPIFSNINMSTAYTNLNPVTGKPYSQNQWANNNYLETYIDKQIKIGKEVQKKLNMIINPPIKKKPQNANPSFLKSVGNLIKEIWGGIKKIASLVNPTKANPVNLYEDYGIIDMVARGSFFSLWFGMLSIIATIAAARSIGIMLGGDVEFAGLTRLI